MREGKQIRVHCGFSQRILIFVVTLPFPRPRRGSMVANNTTRVLTRFFNASSRFYFVSTHEKWISKRALSCTYISFSSPAVSLRIRIAQKNLHRTIANHKQCDYKIDVLGTFLINDGSLSRNFSAHHVMVMMMMRRIPGNVPISVVQLIRPHGRGRSMMGTSRAVGGREDVSIQHFSAVRDEISVVAIFAIRRRFGRRVRVELGRVVAIDDPRAFPRISRRRSDFLTRFDGGEVVAGARALTRFAVERFGGAPIADAIAHFVRVDPDAQVFGKVPANLVRV